MRVLLTESIHAVAVGNLESNGYEVEPLTGSLPEDQLVERLPGVALLGIRSNTRVTARALDAATEMAAQKVTPYQFFGGVIQAVGSPRPARSTRRTQST